MGSFPRPPIGLLASYVADNRAPCACCRDGGTLSRLLLPLPPPPPPLSLRGRLAAWVWAPTARKGRRGAVRVYLLFK